MIVWYKIIGRYERRRGGEDKEMKQEGGEACRSIEGPEESLSYIVLTQCLG